MHNHGKNKFFGAANFVDDYIIQLMHN